tara:strand:+ start:4295 stop:4468 length:174 start_codon:yes stop_codon:yes gene_type:complete
MDLSDERFHRKRVPWKALTREGVQPREVLVEAQKKGLWKLAISAKQRLDNEKRGSSL